MQFIKYGIYMMGKTFYGSPSLIRPLVCNEKIDLTREVATLNGANLVVFTTSFHLKSGLI